MCRTSAEGGAHICRTSAEGGAHMHLVHLYVNTYTRMSSALNRRSALEWFECGNAIEIRNGIMFDFYPGLPHMYSWFHKPGVHIVVTVKVEWIA